MNVSVPSFLNPPNQQQRLWDVLVDAGEVAIASCTGAVDTARTCEHVITTIERLKESGAPEHLWRQLVESALATDAAGDRAMWARLRLLLPPAVSPVAVPPGATAAERWIGYDPEVIKAARESGNDDDYARTLFVHEWYSREELDDLLERARSWRSDDALTRALTVAAESYLYRFGDFQRAESLLQELRSRAVDRRSLASEAKALVRLALAQFALGLLEQATASADAAKAAVEKLGPGAIVPEHPGDTARDIYPEPSMRANFACFFDGDWHSIARHWSHVAGLPERRGVAIVEVGMAAFAHARAGETAESLLLLDALAKTLAQLEPRTWAMNGAVGRAARAVWYLRLEELAAVYRNFALKLIDAGVGNWPTVSNTHTVACMAALSGDLAQASTYFAMAREELIPGAHRPQRAIIDFDEGLALKWFGLTESAENSRDLFQTALTEFRGHEMRGWAARAEAELLLLDYSAAASQQNVHSGASP